MSRGEYDQSFIPVCPVCGHTVADLVRYKVVRPHNERRVGRQGEYISRTRCAGEGEFPEWVRA